MNKPNQLDEVEELIEMPFLSGRYYSFMIRILWTGTEKKLKDVLAIYLVWKFNDDGQIEVEA